MPLLRRALRPSGRASAGCPAAGVFFLTLLLQVPATASLYNPHDFMTKKESCGTCHLSPAGRGDGGFVRDIVSLCRDCHFGRHRDSHPVDIRPFLSGDLPLPLDFESTMTCATCHDPHAEPYSEKPYVREGPLGRIRGFISGKGFRTFFLRMPNDRGQLCLNCHDREETSKDRSRQHPATEPDYRGSETCGSCHGREYAVWRLTVHARTLRNPVSEPGAVRAVFEGGESFAENEILRTVGNHWTQRYLLVRDKEVRVARDVWSIVDGGWRQRYWREQSWRELCAGCHYTGYNPYTNTFAEEGVTCESCHGPGGQHVDSGGRAAIVNPAGLEPEQRDSICASCHTHGHDRTGEFRYPVGYLPGEDLARYYRGLIPKKGQEGDTFRNDGTLVDRLRSYRFWVKRFFAPTGANCTLCKSYRAAEGGRADPTDSTEPDLMTLAEYCLTCHRDIDGNDGRHSPLSDEGGKCYRCHEPQKDRRGRPSIHDHKFVFGFDQRG